MSDTEYYKVKRWEGKPILFRFKYLLANYPEIAFGTALLTIVCPIILAYKVYTYPGSRYEAIKKYKHRYMVFRDDDPKVKEIMAEKNLGREHFPKY